MRGAGNRGRSEIDKALIGTLAWLLALAGPGFLGAGGRMRQGNRLYAKGEYTEAGEIYGNLAVEMPDSPYVRHNLGLTHYRQGEWEQAATAWLSGLDKNTESESGLAGNLHYNLGLCYYQQAQSGLDSSDRKSLLEQSLSSLKQAILANTDDLDAKYNYELVRKELEKAESELSQEPGEQGDDREENDENDTGQDEDGTEENDTKQEQADEEKKAGDDGTPVEGLTEDQARALLEQAEDLEQYGIITEPGQESPVDKDW